MLKRGDGETEKPIGEGRRKDRSGEKMEKERNKDDAAVREKAATLSTVDYFSSTLACC